MFFRLYFLFESKESELVEEEIQTEEPFVESE